MALARREGSTPTSTGWRWAMLLVVREPDRIPQTQPWPDRGRPRLPSITIRVSTRPALDRSLGDTVTQRRTTSQRSSPPDRLRGGQGRPGGAGRDVAGDGAAVARTRRQKADGTSTRHCGMRDRGAPPGRPRRPQSSTGGSSSGSWSSHPPQGRLSGTDPR